MKRHLFICFVLALLFAAVVVLELPTSTSVDAQSDPGSRVGERLTYNVSFEKFRNVAYAETHIVSRGKLGGKDAIEIYTRVKTLDFVSAAYVLVDRERTSFLSPADGSTLSIRDIELGGVVPVETSVNFAEKAPGMLDLSAMIYRIRTSGGTGSLTLYEKDRSYNAAFQTIGSEIVKSDVGEFPTNVIDVKSDYFTEVGITGLKINIANESSAIPVQYRIKTSRGEFRAIVSSIQINEPEPSPTATPMVTPTPRPSPRPSPSPETYIENQPLAPGLPFQLGESLDYVVTTGARRLGNVRLNVGTRRLVNGRDSLLLSASVAAVEPGADIFRQANGIRSHVDPEVFSPFDLEMRFDGPLAGFNEIAKFDPQTSAITVGNAKIDAPVGTHNIVSLAYAIRLFKLAPSKSASNPVNDTRVAVLWQAKPLVFVLRPSEPQMIEMGSQKIAAQQINVSTGDPVLDALQIKVWLSMDPRRMPLRATIGAYQFELNLNNSVLP